jgi:predicted  nucleic acid-binding Zn-ribbon protein
MQHRCTLCRKRIESGEKRVLCQCGRLLHGRCAEAHTDWCDADGRERWIGAVEI